MSLFTAHTTHIHTHACINCHVSSLSTSVCYQQVTYGSADSTLVEGVQVCKWFGEGDDAKLFYGRITSIDSDEKDGTVLYHILYEDNDEEDLTYADCRSTFLLYIITDNTR